MGSYSIQLKPVGVIYLKLIDQSLVVEQLTARTSSNKLLVSNLAQLGSAPMGESQFSSIKEKKKDIGRDLS